MISADWIGAVSLEDPTSAVGRLISEPAWSPVRNGMTAGVPSAALGCRVRDAALITDLTTDVKPSMTEDISGRRRDCDTIASKGDRG